MSVTIFPRRIAVLGSSGSIGKSTLEVIAASERRLTPVLLSAHRQTALLAEQVRQLHRRHLADNLRWLVITDETADRSPLADLPITLDVRFGYDALCELVQHNDIDIVLSAIVGSAGLTSTLSALESGKTVALANKESLVLGGTLLTDLVKTRGGCLLPVDSEHSAVMQALCSRQLENAPALADAETVQRIILTASGGPFRTRSLADLAKVTVEEALAHPTWNMGKKITIDSATLMNKALELIEARWFFDVPASKLSAVIHPQSLVHSLVEFMDGSVLAQMSPPDMRLPIAVALNYPYRLPCPAAKWDWTKAHTLEFFPPDLGRFPAIALGLEVADKGGTAGAAINAANETAAAAFLNRQLSFDKIVLICRKVLEQHHFEAKPTLETLLQVDARARKEADKMIA